MARKFIALAILGFGLAGMVFVFQNRINLNGNENETARKEGLSGNNLVSNKPFVEKLGGQSLLAKLENNLSGQNLTEEFTKNLADKIAGENPDGIQIQDGNKLLAVPDPDQIAIDLLAEAASKFDTENLIPKIKDSDLKIIENNKAAILTYAEKFDEANLGIELPELNNQEEFNNKISGVIENYKKTIAALYQLAVPELMVNLHKTNLAYLSAELKLLEKMQDMKQDPMGAILAGKNFLEVEKDFKNQLVAAVLELDRADNFKLIKILNEQ